MNTTPKSLELTVRTQTALAELRHRMQARLADTERGQTAAEYIGVLVLVVAIVAAVKTLNIDEKIAKAMQAQIAKLK